jgi:hypothetical protein
MEINQEEAPVKPPRQPASLAGQFLKRYRQQPHLTANALAESAPDY